MTPQRVTLITLGVEDLDRATTFYAALGWTPAEVLEKAAFYQMNGLVLGLFRRVPAPHLGVRLGHTFAHEVVAQQLLGHHRGEVLKGAGDGQSHLGGGNLAHTLHTPLGVLVLLSEE